MSERGVIAGINPATRECELVGIDNDDTWAEVREGGYIAVRVATETARVMFGHRVEDVFAYAIGSPTQ